MLINKIQLKKESLEKKETIQQYLFQTPMHRMRNMLRVMHILDYHIGSLVSQIFKKILNFKNPKKTIYVYVV